MNSYLRTLIPKDFHQNKDLWVIPADLIQIIGIYTLVTRLVVSFLILLNSYKSPPVSWYMFEGLVIVLLTRFPPQGLVKVITLRKQKKTE